MNHPIGSPAWAHSLSDVALAATREAWITVLDHEIRRRENIRMYTQEIARLNGNIAALTKGCHCGFQPSTPGEAEDHPYKEHEKLAAQPGVVEDHGEQ